MSDLIERLRLYEPSDVNEDEAADRIEALEAALERIVQWSEAYPLDIFPEPNWNRVRTLLTEDGLSLDAISASNMRHVVEGVGKIARVALDKDDGK